ncbi:DUF6174 domain-containing protein [Nocardioides currus]|uniref:Uncharacterized protein n=1 Tax=Nocardioides currus TaxID=2133958 RepID=A0A2R7YYY2_9ACTN|nr:DUF6174 domain-containing protein [Nocardioides currus]PUA81597.1 hypothetical protein C7S10_05855 [Nocardioides currus]
MKRVLVLALALLPTLGLVVPAHAAGDFEPTSKDDPALVAAWQAWEKKGIDDYTTTVRLSCFCPQAPGVRTVVRDGETRTVTQGTRTLGDGKGWSMDQLFAMLREGYETADRVEVTYTPRGIPKSITIDPEKSATDEERYYTVSLSRS